MKKYLILFICSIAFGQTQIRSLNGSLVNSQRLTLDTTATANEWAVSNGVHTLGLYFSRIVTTDSQKTHPYPISTKTADYTITNGDYTILVSCSSANITITLPSASANTGRIYNIKKIDATGYSVIIDPNSSELVDGYSTISFDSKNTVYSIQSNGTGWYVVH